ncbi:hypothetical protein C8J56DRAFT_1165014 [Mycena floridula]|nr:hypothetical protein C8J56DRAFT_1165014 [Mycena floridula]
MPFFSVVRRGKQRKVTIDSPVSSGLVEQHISPTMAESSHSQIRQPSEAGNVFSGTRAANSHGLTSGLVALSQHMEGVSIGNIKGNMMSNNQVNITNYYQSQAKDSDASLCCVFKPVTCLGMLKQFAVLRVGDIHLEEEIESYLDANNVWRTRYKGQIMASSASNMSIWTYRGEKGAETLEKAYKKYASLPRHPNILQLYGVCCSPHLTALVFHGAPYFIDRRDYYKNSLPSSQWIPHYIKLYKQYESAHSMLEAHNLHGWVLRASHVDETGKLVIAQFFPGPTVDSAFDPRIRMAFETNTFIKEDLLDYYNPLDKAVPFQLSHPGIDLLVYSLPGWYKVVNGMDIMVKQTGIVLTLLPNMTIRCCIPTPRIPTLSIFETIRLFEQDDMTLFATWACQANHLIYDLPINIMDLQTELFMNWIYFHCHAWSIADWKNDTESPGLNNLLETEHLYLFCPLKEAGNIYWSLDEQGQHIIEVSLIQAAFGITKIHESCGFDPYSTQVAEYLGLPVTVTDGGHSGLEKCMEDPEESELRNSDYVLSDFNSDVEDPEYDSESESGDSNYESASEDV